MKCQEAVKGQETLPAFINLALDSGELSAFHFEHFMSREWSVDNFISVRYKAGWAPESVRQGGAPFTNQFQIFSLLQLWRGSVLDCGYPSAFHHQSNGTLCKFKLNASRCMFSSTHFLWNGNSLFLWLTSWKRVIHSFWTEVSWSSKIFPTKILCAFLISPTWPIKYSLTDHVICLEEYNRQVHNYSISFIHCHFVLGQHILLCIPFWNIFNLYNSPAKDIVAYNVWILNEPSTGQKMVNTGPYVRYN